MQLVDSRLQLKDNKSVFRAYLLICEVLQSSNDCYFGLKDSEGRKTFPAYFALVEMVEGSRCITEW